MIMTSNTANKCSSLSLLLWANPSFWLPLLVSNLQHLLASNKPQNKPENKPHEKRTRRARPLCFLASCCSTLAVPLDQFRLNAASAPLVFWAAKAKPKVAHSDSHFDSSVQFEFGCEFLSPIWIRIRIRALVQAARIWTCFGLANWEKLRVCAAH